MTNEKYAGDFAENCFPAIIDRETWDAAQFELKRQKEYCEAHSLAAYAKYSKESPFATRIICGVCGRTYIQLHHKGEPVEGYWRCNSFHGKQGKEVPGKSFTPRPRPLRQQNRTATRWIKYYKRKLPEARPMRCTDIEIREEEPEKAFVSAWNLLISRCGRYEVSLKNRMNTGENALERYRCGRLLELMKEKGRIKAFEYELSLEVLDHIEVTPEGELRVIFLAGVTTTV